MICNRLNYIRKNEVWKMYEEVKLCICSAVNKSLGKQDHTGTSEINSELADRM